MNRINDAGVVADPRSELTSYVQRLRGLAVTGLLAALAAMVISTLAAALARAVGVDFDVPDGGETIPLSGFTVVTGADTATIAALIGLHLIAAAVVIPATAWRLRAQAD